MSERNKKVDEAIEIEEKFNEESDKDKKEDKLLDTQEKDEKFNENLTLKNNQLKEINRFLNKDEKVISFVRYQGKFNRVKIVGQTNKRSFGYRSIFNRKNFVSSRRSISHIEFGKWRIPIWLWIIIGLTFIPPISMVFSPEMNSLASDFFIPPTILVIFCIIFRRFTYLGTAIGSHFFHILTRKEHLLDDATSFIKIIHLQPYFGKPHSESYIVLNYFAKWIRFFIIFIAILLLIIWITLLILSFQLL